MTSVNFTVFRQPLWKIISSLETRISADICSSDDCSSDVDCFSMSSDIFRSSFGFLFSSSETSTTISPGSGPTSTIVDFGL